MGKKEKQPNPEENRYFLDVDGEQYYMTPENSFAYLHKAEPWYDHIFVQLPPNDEGQEMGTFIWRLKQENFDEMLEYLYGKGMEHFIGTTVSDFDKRVFEEAGLKAPTVKEPEHYELTPRQERLAQFMAYILMTEQLNAAEFEGSGDLHI